MARVRILVADDHQKVRQAIRRLLSVRTEWDVIAEAGNGAEALQMAIELQPDLVIIDAAMPTLNGLAATREIARASPGTRIVMLTIHDDEEYVVEAFEAGANGYVIKDAADRDLVQAADRVLAGGRFVSSGADVPLPARYIPPDSA